MQNLINSLLALGLAATAVPALAQHEHEHGPGDHNDDATIEHRFEDAQAWADHFEDPERDAWQLPDQVVKALCFRKDLVIADIGSATGYFPLKFARACPRGLVVGADIEPTMVFYLNDRAREEGLDNLVSILAAPDDPHLPFPVDLIFICNTYHHINDRLDYFAGLRGSLRENGRLAIVDFEVDSQRGPPHKLHSRVVKEELGEAGFALVEEFDFLPDQYFLVFEAD